MVLHRTLRDIPSACRPHQAGCAQSPNKKGIDPLNLYELQFVPAARPVRGLRNVGTSAEGCVRVVLQLLRRGEKVFTAPRRSS